MVEHVSGLSVQTVRPNDWPVPGSPYNTLDRSVRLFELHCWDLLNWQSERTIESIGA